MLCLATRRPGTIRKVERGTFYAAERCKAREAYHKSVVPCPITRVQHSFPVHHIFTLGRPRHTSAENIIITVLEVRLKPSIRYPKALD